MILFGHRTGERFSSVLLDGAAAAGARGSWSYFFSSCLVFGCFFFVCLVFLFSRGSGFCVWLCGVAVRGDGMGLDRDRRGRRYFGGAVFCALSFLKECFSGCRGVECGACSVGCWKEWGVDVLRTQIVGCFGVLGEKKKKHRASFFYCRLVLSLSLRELF